MVIKCIRARTYGKYITLIKAGTLSKFRIFFQKLSMKIFYTRNFHFTTFHLNPSTLVLIPNFLYKYL
jgi:hypothetical protein